MADLKEFLKPTPLKIILFVLFPFFFAQTGFVICENIMAPCPQPFGFLPLIFAVFSYAEFGFSPLYLIGAIPSYLLACVFAHFRNKKVENDKRPAGIMLASVVLIFLSIIALVIGILAIPEGIDHCNLSYVVPLCMMFNRPQTLFAVFGVLGFVCSLLILKMNKIGLWLSIITGIISIMIFYFTGFNSNIKEIWFLAMVLWAYIIVDLMTKRKLFA